MRRVGKKQKQDPQALFDQHIRSLGLCTREQYLSWCRALGFPIAMQKHRKQLAREIVTAKSLHQNSHRNAQESTTRDALDWVLDACNGDDPARIRVAHVEYVARRLAHPDADGSEERPSAQVLMDIAQHVSKQKAKLFFEPVIASPRFTQSDDNTFLAGLMLLSAYESRWIIDYLHQERFVSVEGESAKAVHGPRQPNLSMKGRSPESLLEQVVRWHRDLAKNSGQKIRIWKSTSIQPLRLTEGKIGDPNFKIWTIRELTTQQSLFAEGRKLKHCVASYVSSCAKGQSSIWSMELEQSSVVEKRVTIEVNPATRHIVQVRGKLNRHPNQQELNTLRRWSTEANLVLRT